MANENRTSATIYHARNSVNELRKRLGLSPLEVERAGHRPVYWRLVKPTSERDPQGILYHLSTAEMAEALRVAALLYQELLRTQAGTNA